MVSTDLVPVGISGSPGEILRTGLRFFGELEAALALECAKLFALFELAFWILVS